MSPEGGVRLGGSPSLWVEGSGNWVSVSWEEAGTDAKHLLGSGVPEAISAGLAGFLQELPNLDASEPAEWVLSLDGPVRALFAKPGPTDGELSLFWQEAADGSAAVQQTAPVSEVEAWCRALELYGPADPDEVVRPDRRDL